MVVLFFVFWLVLATTASGLLNAKSTAGTGPLSRTATIQRVQTVGGKAPASGCSQAQAGKEARVPYEARYYFYVVQS